MVRSWLHRCIEHHEPCRIGLDDLRPARLLDLGAFLDDEDIQLVLADETGKQDYATLSYSWGNTTTVTVTSENYKDFRSRIGLKTLPLTIQEGIKFCRQLSIRYLWVDALCIIQENDEDFAQEISQMGSIYAGCLVTLAAADSTDCESGCFRGRDLRLKMEPCTFSDGEEEVIFSVVKSGYPCTHDIPWWTTKLERRVWVYQERMMAPRTVHFIKNEIIWECRERTLCYNCAEIKWPRYPSDYAKGVKKAFIRLHRDEVRFSMPAIFRHTWSKIIKGYSETILSNVDDRLSALAGIAQLVCQNSTHQASYGLWHHIILDELLWSAKWD
jgi:hypothetical protein